MKIVFYGHACFTLQAKVQETATDSRESVTVVTDPYPSSIGLTAPTRVSADIVLVSHEHEEHSNVDAIKGDPVVIDEPGEYDVKGVGVEGFTAYHDAKEGEEWGRVTQYTISMEGMRIAFLSDIGQKELTDEQVERIGLADILFLPVGGTWTIGPKEAAAIINQVEPRMIIPMHYKLKGLVYDLAPVDDFLKEIGSTAEKTDTMTVSPSKLPQDEMQVVVLEARGVK